MARRLLTAREQYEMLAPWREAAGAENPHLPWDPPDTSVSVHAYLHPDEVMGYAREDNEWRNVDNLHGLAQHLDQHGMQEPIHITTNGVNAEIADGHHRALAAKGRGWDKVPVHITHDPYMDEDEDADNVIGPGLQGHLNAGGPMSRISGIVISRPHTGSVIDDYRIERHRQEVELEGLTGGHPADIKDYFDRGGKPLINYKQWLKSRGGEQDRMAEPIDPHHTYTPDSSWDDKPLW